MKKGGGVQYADFPLSQSTKPTYHDYQIEMN